MKKKTISIALALVFALSLLPSLIVTSSAMNVSNEDIYSLVSTANGAVGKTAAQLGLPNSNWCGYFVGYCINHSSIASTLGQIPSNACNFSLSPIYWVCNTKDAGVFYATSKTHAARLEEISPAFKASRKAVLIDSKSFVPAAGDIIQFTWKPWSVHEFSHVGIVTAVNGNTITYVDGNSGSGKGKVASHVMSKTSTNIIGYIRFSQTSNNSSVSPSKLPSDFNITVDKEQYTLGENVKISPSANGATHYAISVWKGAFGAGERLYANFNLPGGITFTPSQEGSYTIRADAKNSAGYISIEKTFEVRNSLENKAVNSPKWAEWSDWSTDHVEETNSRQVEIKSLLISDAHTEYRYGRYIDAIGTHVCWCGKYLETWRSSVGYSTLQYSDWSENRYATNGKAWTCGFCNGSHIGVHHISTDGRAWWAQYELPSGNFYWEESRWVEAKYETQYRYRDSLT